jgi:hypothetical protein
MASAPPSITSKDEFVNTSDGWVGAVQIDHTGKANGVSVPPGGSVFLTEEEQILTANAPSRDEDNPFVLGWLRLQTRAVHMRNRRPFGELDESQIRPGPDAEDDDADEEAMTGQTPVAQGEPELGAAAAGEEVASPAATRRKRS